MEKSTKVYIIIQGNNQDEYYMPYILEVYKYKNEAENKVKILEEQRDSLASDYIYSEKHDFWEIHEQEVK